MRWQCALLTQGASVVTRSCHDHGWSRNVSFVFYSSHCPKRRPTTQGGRILSIRSLNHRSPALLWAVEIHAGYFFLGCLSVGSATAAVNARRAPNDHEWDWHNVCSSPERAHVTVRGAVSETCPLRTFLYRSSVERTSPVHAYSFSLWSPVEEAWSPTLCHLASAQGPKKHPVTELVWRGLAVGRCCHRGLVLKIGDMIVILGRMFWFAAAEICMSLIEVADAARALPSLQFSFTACSVYVC